MDAIIKIVELLLKQQNTKQKKSRQISRCYGCTYGCSSLIAPMASLLIQPVASSLINAITRKGVMRVGNGQEGRFLSLLALPLMM